MRLFRKWTSVCQNCVNGNNDKGKYLHTYKRKDIEGEKGYWHIFCERKQKYYPWDAYKFCFKVNKYFEKR